jgi:protein SCO1/2
MVDFAATLKSLPPDVAGHIKVVFVTTDPERDTPDVMRTWLDNFNPNFIGLTGTPGQLQALQDELGVPAAAKEDDGHGGYGVSHAAFTFAFTPNDNIAHIVYPVGLSRDELASDFTSLVKNGWTAN